MTTAPSSHRPTKLRQTLARLRAELAGAPRVDPASRQRLQELLEEIERLLGTLERSNTESSPDGLATPIEAPHGLERRLESVAVTFEADHPSLAGSLRQLTELLANAGL